MAFVKLTAMTAGAAAGVILATTAVWADDVARAQSLVESFYTSLIDEKYEVAIDMFQPNAKATSVYNFGKAYPEETITYSPRDLKQYIEAEIPVEYQQYFEGYKETAQSFEILGAQRVGEDVTVTGRLTTDYEISGYKGKIFQNDTFKVTFPSEGNPAFSSYHGVTTYK